MSWYSTNEKELKKRLNNYLEDLKGYQPELFERSNLLEVLDYLEKRAMKHALRSYQLEALAMLDHFIKNKNDELLKELYEKIEIDDLEGNTVEEDVPFITFEMATGSGKTLLMGAMMLFMKSMYGIENFLVITPHGKIEIYNKTILNFSKGNSRETVWAKDSDADFNLITGDDYNRSSLFDSKKDFNIFLFNIDKFGPNATNTQKPFESSAWRDEENNCLSLKQFLRNKKMVIFTDEAHHTQNANGAKKIIKNFHPRMVLEFTATAREEENKKQKVLYKYTIKNLLEEKYCKIVKAFGVLNPHKKKTESSLTNTDKIKIIASLLIHLAKKHCLQFDPSTENLKPLLFIKINKTIDEGEEIFKFIKNRLLDDEELLDIALREIETQSTEITKVVDLVVKKTGKPSIIKTMKSIVNNAIFLHSKSSEETRRVYSKIEDSQNPCEIVQYIYSLDEGIDLPNIYTICVINDSQSELLTPVKQIIGRGVRLNKPKREFDDETDIFKLQTERIHIVCDRDKNFEKVILDIQKEFGVIDKFIGFDSVKESVLNTPDTERLSGKYLPRIKADLKVNPDLDVFTVLEDHASIVGDYIADNCFKDSDNNIFLKYVPESLFTEVNVFADEKIFHDQLLKNGGRSEVLSVSKKYRNRAIGRLIAELDVITDSLRTKDALEEYFKLLDEKPLHYYSTDQNTDSRLCQDKFINTFCCFFKSYIEKRCYNLKHHVIDREDDFALEKEFGSYEIHLQKSDDEAKAIVKSDDKDKLTDMVRQEYHFSHFKHSIYPYVKFDSYTEYKMATLLDLIIDKQDIPDKHFWIKNQRNVYFQYGSRHYFPDFIALLGGDWYVIETKGEAFSELKKNMLLFRLNDVEHFHGVLLLEKAVDEIYNNKIMDINKIIEISLRKSSSEDTQKEKKELF